MYIRMNVSPRCILTQLDHHPAAPQQLMLSRRGIDWDAAGWSSAGCSLEASTQSGNSASEALLLMSILHYSGRRATFHPAGTRCCTLLGNQYQCNYAFRRFAVTPFVRGSRRLLLKLSGWRLICSIASAGGGSRYLPADCFDASSSANLHYDESLSRLFNQRRKLQAGSAPGAKTPRVHILGESEFKLQPFKQLIGFSTQPFVCR